MKSAFCTHLESSYSFLRINSVWIHFSYRNNCRKVSKYVLNINAAVKHEHTWILLVKHKVKKGNQTYCKECCIIPHGPLEQPLCLVPHKYWRGWHSFDEILIQQNFIAPTCIWIVPWSRRTFKVIKPSNVTPIKKILHNQNIHFCFLPSFDMFWCYLQWKERHTSTTNESWKIYQSFAPGKAVSQERFKPNLWCIMQIQDWTHVTDSRI